MAVKELSINSSEYPEKLRHIPMPPKRLYILGSDVNELLTRPSVTVVGSRKVSVYGKTITTQLTGELAKAGLVIISGLAFGVDSLAHQAALDAGGLTIAVLPTGVNTIYPAEHHGLARQILQRGGALVSEYPPGTNAYKGNFVARNRIGSGLGDAVLITEAAEKSGTLHTAAFGLEQGKPVLAVPGNITSPTSRGTNQLIKTGAVPVTSAQDVFLALGLDFTRQSREVPRSNNPNEQLLLDLLFADVNDADQLLVQSGLNVSLFNQALTMLEIRGTIRPLGNNRWALQ